MTTIPRWLQAVLCSLALALVACGGGEPAAQIDLTVRPARLDEAPEAPPPDGWQRVVFAGTARSRAGTYLVADEPLLSGWNITAFRAAEAPDGLRAITIRLNAAGRQKLARFVEDEANLKAPLALQIDGRWADFSPLLRPPGDRLTLNGLTPEEVDLLERWLEVR